MRAAECAKRAKDRAVVTLLLYTGIHIFECADLDLDDVYAQRRKNRIIVRNGKGGRYREIPLNSEACETIQAWLQERARQRNRPGSFYQPARQPDVHISPRPNRS